MLGNDLAIKQVVERIDAKIQKLLDLKQLLLEEFSEGVGKITRDFQPELNLDIPARDPNDTKGTRKNQLIESILADGPGKRTELAKRTNMPIGSISYLLNDKQTFTSIGNGQWDLTPAAKQARKENAIRLLG